MENNENLEIEVIASDYDNGNGESLPEPLDLTLPHKWAEVDILVSMGNRSQVNTSYEAFTMDYQTPLIIINFKYEQRDGTVIPLDLTDVEDVILGFQFVEVNARITETHAEVLDVANGQVAMILPNQFAYSGGIFIHTYLVYKNGRSFDAGSIHMQFTKSWLDKEVPELEGHYIPLFEDLKRDILRRAQEMEETLDEILRQIQEEGILTSPVYGGTYTHRNELPLELGSSYKEVNRVVLNITRECDMNLSLMAVLNAKKLTRIEGHILLRSYDSLSNKFTTTYSIAEFLQRIDEGYHTLGFPLKISEIPSGNYLLQVYIKTDDEDAIVIGTGRATFGVQITSVANEIPAPPPPPPIDPEEPIPPIDPEDPDEELPTDPEEPIPPIDPEEPEEPEEPDEELPTDPIPEGDYEPDIRLRDSLTELPLFIIDGIHDTFDMPEMEFDPESTLFGDTIEELIIDPLEIEESLSVQAYSSIILNLDEKVLFSELPSLTIEDYMNVPVTDSLILNPIENLEINEVETLKITEEQTLSAHDSLVLNTSESLKLQEVETLEIVEEVNKNTADGIALEYSESVNDITVDALNVQDEYEIVHDERDHLHLQEFVLHMHNENALRVSDDVNLQYLSHQTIVGVPKLVRTGDAVFPTHLFHWATHEILGEGVRATIAKDSTTQLRVSGSELEIPWAQGGLHSIRVRRIIELEFNVFDIMGTEFSLDEQYEIIFESYFEGFDNVLVGNIPTEVHVQHPVIINTPLITRFDSGTIEDVRQINIPVSYVRPDGTLRLVIATDSQSPDQAIALRLARLYVTGMVSDEALLPPSFRVAEGTPTAIRQEIGEWDGQRQFGVAPEVTSAQFTTISTDNHTSVNLQAQVGLRNILEFEFNAFDIIGDSRIHNIIALRFNARWARLSAGDMDVSIQGRRDNIEKRLYDDNNMSFVERGFEIPLSALRDDGTVRVAITTDSEGQTLLFQHARLTVAREEMPEVLYDYVTAQGNAREFRTDTTTLALPHFDNLSTAPVQDLAVISLNNGIVELPPLASTTGATVRRAVGFKFNVKDILGNVRHDRIEEIMFKGLWTWSGNAPTTMWVANPLGGVFTFSIAHATIATMREIRLPLECVHSNGDIVVVFSNSAQNTTSFTLTTRFITLEVTAYKDTLQPPPIPHVRFAEVFAREVRQHITTNTFARSTALRDNFSQDATLTSPISDANFNTITANTASVWNWSLTWANRRERTTDIVLDCRELLNDINVANTQIDLFLLMRHSRSNHGGNLAIRTRDSRTNHAILPHLSTSNQNHPILNRTYQIHPHIDVQGNVTARVITSTTHSSGTINHNIQYVGGIVAIYGEFGINEAFTEIVSQLPKKTLKIEDNMEEPLKGIVHEAEESVVTLPRKVLKDIDVQVVSKIGYITESLETEVTLVKKKLEIEGNVDYTLQ